MLYVWENVIEHIEHMARLIIIKHAIKAIKTIVVGTSTTHMLCKTELTLESGRYKKTAHQQIHK